MNGRIPKVAIVGVGAVSAGAAILASSRARMGYLIGGGVAILAAVVWNSYIEERLIAQVVAAGVNYPAPPAEIERGAQ